VNTTGEMPPDLPVRSPRDSDVVASVGAISALIQSFVAMVGGMEGRLADQIRENAVASKERWGRWEGEFNSYKVATDRRVEIVEVQLKDHLQRKHDADLVAQARIKPVQTTLGWFVKNWQMVLLFVISMIAILGFVTDTIRGLLS
jgi:hypothetical protein